MQIGLAHGNRVFVRLLMLGALVLLTAAFSPLNSAAADKETILYNFCARGGRACTDGAGPLALIMDKSGNLYGTTSNGGAYCQSNNPPGCGTVFKLTPNAARTKWRAAVLYSFCSRTNCTDGHGANVATSRQVW